LATKLRRFSTHKLTKFIAFILTVLLLTATVLQVQYLAYQGLDVEPYFRKKYNESMKFSNEIWYAFHLAMNLIERGEGYQVPEDIDFYYYIDDGDKKYTNAPGEDKSFFAQNDQAFYAYEKGELTLGTNTSAVSFPEYLHRYLNSSNGRTAYTIYIAFPNKFMEWQEDLWAQSRRILIPQVNFLIAGLAVAILLIIFLCFVTGRKAEDQEVHPARIDGIYSDILVMALFFPWIFMAMAIGEAAGVSGYQQLGQLSIYQIYNMIMLGIVTFIVTTIDGVIFLSLVRKIKARRLLRHSLCYTVCYKIYDFFKSLIDGRRFEQYPLTKILFARQRNFIILSSVIVFFALLFLLAAPPLFFFMIILELVLIYWYTKYNNRTFAEINKGFNESLEEQMRSERMKIALVTNVSHDLKTPLTSIISYVDLLAKEEDLSETARDYVTILAEKAERLKHIVSDLFDLAKSSSGDIQLELEQLDLKKLIEQTLGDMEDRIAGSGLQFKVKLPEKPVNIYSDGKKLYRVFQNIIDNALKYSLHGTRVYIDLEEKDGKAVATVKNTAGYEMDFTAEEILQRFARGDKSRSTEGSGLGLSIAESFTHVCGGNFKVDIDGDLFKVTISFPVN